MVVVCSIDNISIVERVDGTQARLKHHLYLQGSLLGSRGKGGWDSGEIETKM